MKVAVIGLGHVGLVSAAAFASLGDDVIGMDNDVAKVTELSAGRAPFHEPKLDELLREGLASGCLSFTTHVAGAVADAAVVFICVGRPSAGLEDRSLTAVEDTVRAVMRAAATGVVLVVKSTVPPGTSERVRRVAAQERPALDFAVASSPEFLREGHAVDDTLEPDRLVVGTDDERARAVLRELHQPLIASGIRLIETDAVTAELAKLSSNAFLALKISYANGLARLAELTGADVVGVTEILGADPRIAPAFLGAGLGFGGFCLPKDLVTLDRVSNRLGYDFAMLREALRINEEALGAVLHAVEEAVWNLEGKTVALLGLAFKAGTDDVRTAPALNLARRLLDEGATVTGYDPMAADAASREQPAIKVFGDPYEAAKGAACVLLCTEWPEFRELDLPRLAGATATPILVDGRNYLDPATVRAAGFTYRGVGRGITD
jgi:UDPglucose 6-dehydrogenase